MICPRCQEVLKDGARFCSNCGISFSSLKTPTEQAEGHDLPETLAELDPLVGQVLDGKYELLARLGEGGMGAVYRARRVHIGDEVALKVLLRKFVADSGLVERFRREARAAAALRHENVVRIYDYGESRNDDVPAYIVMELVEGESLRHLLQHERRLRPERAAALMRDICAGVGAAHRRQIFHRDLKPDNVIVLPPDEDRERETVKVVDFGIAKLRDASGAPTLTETGALLGTLLYMSPEQCRGEQPDARSDVYSLGAMLYEMLAGKPPFVTPNLMGVLAKHIIEPPPPLPPDAHVPPALAAVIMRSLAKDPDARPADAAELSRGLRAAEEAAARQRDEEAKRARGEEQRRLQEAEAARLAEEEWRREEERAREEMRLRQEAEEERRRKGAEVLRGAEEERREREDERAGRVVEQSKRTDDLKQSAVGKKKRRLAAIAALAFTVVGGGVIVSQSVFRYKGGNANANLSQQVRQATEDKRTEAAPVTASTPEPPPGMVYVPGGTFTMGRNDGDDYERPAHSVSVRSFFVDVYEVTCGDYERFVGATGHRAPIDWRRGACPPGAEQKPVTGVTWDDAQAYARWAGKRLPTEEEWEFAARGTDGRRYPWGDEWHARLANANGASRGMADVGTYRGASPFGAFDMAGNAWEWTDSGLKAYPGGRLPEQPASNAKVLRGGSYKSNKSQATTTYRFGWRASGEASYSETGFRCVKDISDTSTSPQD